MDIFLKLRSNVCVVNKNMLFVLFCGDNARNLKYIQSNTNPTDLNFPSVYLLTDIVCPRTTIVITSIQ